MRDPEYRKAFVASQISVAIPLQLRALLKSRGKTQEWLAGQAGMLQPRISGLMSPGKVRPNIETLRRVAEAFDCALAVRFVPFGELAEWAEGFDPEHFEVPTFEQDMAMRNSGDQIRTIVDRFAQAQQEKATVNESAELALKTHLSEPGIGTGTRPQETPTGSVRDFGIPGLQSSPLGVPNRAAGIDSQVGFDNVVHIGGKGQPGRHGVRRKSLWGATRLNRGNRRQHAVRKFAQAHG